jgi:hypothetical protein
VTPFYYLAACHYAECHYVECHGAVFMAPCMLYFLIPLI